MKNRKQLKLFVQMKRDPFETEVILRADDGQEFTLPVSKLNISQNAGELPKAVLTVLISGMEFDWDMNLTLEELWVVMGDEGFHIMKKKGGKK